MSLLSKRRGRTREEDLRRGLFEEGIITRIDDVKDGGRLPGGTGASITFGQSGEDIGGLGCFLSCPAGVIPKIGDRVRIYGTFGQPFHGQDLNDTSLWYLSEDEERAERRIAHARMEQERGERFLKERPRLDEQYEALPAFFQIRIDRFREANPDFRMDWESYEMFTCTQAVVIAEWAVSQVDQSDPGWKESACRKIDEWDAINSKNHNPPYDYRTQRAMIPGYSDAHSGNTHTAAVVLAETFIRSAQEVVDLPGVGWPLAGTYDYSERKSG